jgi:hypothetical protein
MAGCAARPQLCAGLLNDHSGTPLGQALGDIAAGETGVLADEVSRAAKAALV